MPEGATIRPGASPQTRDSLLGQFRGLGIRPGDAVLVHSSLGALGWTSGGAVAVIEALCDAVTPSGTLAMPAQSADLTDPSGWEAPPVPTAWWDRIRHTMPAFDPDRTPTRDMGRIAELFRCWPDVRRSNHPTGSFCAWGQDAKRVADAPQPLGDPFGQGSPLSALLEMDASVLLLGVGFDCCTALHLAERLAWPDAPTRAEGSPVMVDGRRRWVRYRAPVYRTELFEAAGGTLLSRGIARTGPVGAAMATLVPLRGMIEAMVPHWQAGDR